MWPATPAPAGHGTAATKRRYALLAAVLSAVILMVLGVGGWAWPGWWSNPSAPLAAPSNDSPVPPTMSDMAPAEPLEVPSGATAPGAPKPPVSGAGSASGNPAAQAAQAIVDRLNARDLDGVKALTCKPGQAPGDNGVPLVVQDVRAQVPPLNPARPDLHGVTTTFTFTRIVTVNGEADVAALVDVAYTNVPPATATDPTVGPLLTAHQGATRMKNEDGRWVTCAMRLAPRPGANAPTPPAPPR